MVQMTYQQLTETYRIPPDELDELIKEFREAGGNVGRFGVSDGEDLPIDLFFPLETAPVCAECGLPIEEDEVHALPLWLRQINQEMCAACLNELPITSLLEEGKLTLYILLLVYDGRLKDVLPFLSLDSAREYLRDLTGLEIDAEVITGVYARSLIVSKHMRPM